MPGNYITHEELNKVLEEKFTNLTLEFGTKLNTKFDMLMKRLEELKPTNTHPPAPPINGKNPITEPHTTDSSATHSNPIIHLNIDESSSQHDKILPGEVTGLMLNKPKEVAYVNQPYKRHMFQTTTKPRSHKDDSFEDYNSDEEDMVEATQAQRWRDDKRLKEGQQQVRYGALPEYKVKADIPNFNGMFKIEELLDWLYEIESFF